MSKTTSRTLNDFLKELAAKDKTLRQWASEKKFDLSTVYAVAHGRTKGKWGESRRVMRAMGLSVPETMRATQD